MAKTKIYWPSTRYGPDGQHRVFKSEDEIPDGWVDHPSKLSGMPDLAHEQETARAEVSEAKGARVAAEERIRLARIEERRRTGSNTAADNVVRHNLEVVEQAEKQRSGSNTEAQADSNDLGSIKEIRRKYAAGELTLDEIEAAEKKRSDQRSTIFDLIERERKLALESAKTEETEIVTREEAIAELRRHDVEISDDATDAEIEAALSKLES